MAAGIRRLVLRMAAANPLRRAPRIHGQLKMLGIVISESTVSRILRTIRSHPPSQTWQTFLRNRLDQIVTVDFFTVPTIRLRVLFVFLVLEHSRREVLSVFDCSDLQSQRIRALAKRIQYLPRALRSEMRQLLEGVEIIGLNELRELFRPHLH